MAESHRGSTFHPEDRWLLYVWQGRLAAVGSHSVLLLVHMTGRAAGLWKWDPESHTHDAQLLLLAVFCCSGWSLGRNQQGSWSPCTRSACARVHVCVRPQLEAPLVQFCTTPPVRKPALRALVHGIGLGGVSGPSVPLGRGVFSPLFKPELEAESLDLSTLSHWPLEASMQMIRHE